MMYACKRIMSVCMAIMLMVSALLYVVWKRVLYCLRYMQQDEYSSGRFLLWCIRRRAYERAGTACLCGGVLLWIALPFAAWVMTALTLAVVGVLYMDPRKTGKLPLKMTSRAKRIVGVSFVCAVVVVLAIMVVAPMPLLAFVIVLQAVPLWLVIANVLLAPYERWVQRRYYRDAQRCIAAVRPFVIGVTGSFGKTSTKYMLGEVLRVTLGPTFWPEGGVNTVMGITREIRQSLRSYDEYAVIEIGAYRRGSITRSCALTQPRAGIITGIGPCHLERFGSIENIVEAKSELAQAISDDGILVCNGDDPNARHIGEKYRKKVTLLYGYEGDGLDCRIVSSKLDGVTGTSFLLSWRGKEYKGKVSLFGATALSNMMAAFTMACALGADPAFVLAALSTVPPVSNRLQVDRIGEVTYIKDAYNSNPTGFVSALDVLGILPAQRRYIMTPGIVELGYTQYDVNYDVGKAVGKTCDVALVIGDINRDALVRGCVAGGMKDGAIVTFDSREEGFRYLSSAVGKGDAVLIENDLPDVYEVTL